MNIPVEPFKRARVALVAAGVLAILALVYCTTGRGGGEGFATPEACLEAYRDAILDGDRTRFRRCLAPPLRVDDTARFEAARQQLRTAGHWGQYPPEVAGDEATILVDQVRQDGMIHRVPYRLQRYHTGWLLADVGRPEVRRPPIRPGTHVGDAEGK